MIRTAEKFTPNKVTTPAEHRALIIAGMEALVEGRINVPQANALAGLSAEVHKSLKQEWDMCCYAAEHLALDGGRLIKVIGAGD